MTADPNIIDFRSRLERRQELDRADKYCRVMAHACMDMRVLGADIGTIVALLRAVANGFEKHDPDFAPRTVPTLER